jgi:hypothetical protein
MNFVLGWASIAMGLLAVGVGGRAAMTAQRPSWLTVRSIPWDGKGRGDWLWQCWVLES